jgi:protein TonB
LARAAPPPEYPRLSRRAGEEGSVFVRLELDAQGHVLTVVVLESSGFARLDEAAVEALKKWRFDPRREDGRAVSSVVLHRVRFVLSDVQG